MSWSFHIISVVHGYSKEVVVCSVSSNDVLQHHDDSTVCFSVLIKRTDGAYVQFNTIVRVQYRDGRDTTPWIVRVHSVYGHSYTCMLFHRITEAVRRTFPQPPDGPFPKRVQTKLNTEGFLGTFVCLPVRFLLGTSMGKKEGLPIGTSARRQTLQ